MKVVEFQNTQGVEVQYICADLVERIIAFVIDTAIVSFSITILYAILEGMSGIAENMFILFVVIPLAFFYHLLFELLNDGQSLGKLIVGIKVARVDGMPVQTNDLLMRWMFRLVDFLLTTGVLAAVFVGVTPRSQRLGDVLADTTVIKVKHRKTGLNRVMSLTTLTKHKPKYLQKAVFTEDQMLMIKEVYDRSASFPSKENREMLASVAENVAAAIGIETPENHKVFLTQVVKDYVALTR